MLVSEPGVLLGLTLSPDGRRIVSGNRDGGISVRRADTGAELAHIRIPDATLTAVEVAPDGACVAGSYSDGTKRVFAVAPGGGLPLLREERLDGIELGPFAPGRTELMMVAVERRTFFRWNYRTGARSQEIETPLKRVWSVQPHPDGKTVVVSGLLDPQRGLIQLRDLATGRLLVEREFGHLDPAARIANPIVSVAFSRDGSYFATTHGQDFTVRLWNAATLEPNATLAGHTEIVRGTTFSPDGTRLATSADDYTIRIWKAPSGEPLLALRTGGLRRVVAVDFTPDGDSILSGEVTNWGLGPSEIRMWRSRG